MAIEKFIELEDQGRLAGILHIPENIKGKCPLVIYCPGKNGERYEVHRLAVKYARKLAKKGIATLRFDYYGMGLSDGFYYDMTTTTKVSNIEAAFNYASKLDFVNKDQIAYLGFSDGARIAIMSANRTNVNKVVIWSPLFDEYGGNYPNNKRPKFSRHKYRKDKLVMPWAGLWVSMDFYRDLKNIEIIDEIKSYSNPSLLIFGGDDPLVQEEMEFMSVDELPIYQGTTKNQTYTIPKAGHLFTSEELENTLMTKTTNWLLSQFS
ncbi:prolyl oligopeptidase family serine peptidase [Bacillus sp. SM2101]|uniref:alpha/beta hydrolase n=1 Tax=Bacillus sp. SM2101 TaxID=2805366 RepID=UPI001BDEB66E|nr:prolyl oligopeptidase family serine peptidase [Bacillus sp. SM2101]